MMRFDGMDHLRAFLVLLRKLHTKSHMAPFHLVIHGLSQIMEQSGTLGEGHVLSQFSGDQSAKMRHLNGVIEHVLSVAGTVFLPAQQLDDFRMESMHSCFKGCPFALLLDGLLHLPAGLVHHIVDMGGLNPSVRDELFQRNSGDFPADRIKAGEGNGLRSIVDDQVHAGLGLQRPDIPAFPADDPSFHLIVGQRHHGNGGFGRVIRGAALNGGYDDLFRPLVGLFLQLVLDLLDFHGGLVPDLGFHVPQQVFLGLFRGHAGDFLQHFKLSFLQTGDFLLSGGHIGEFLVEFLILALVLIHLFVQGLLLLLKAALLLLDLVAALPDLLFVLAPASMDLFLRFHEHLALLVLRALDGLVDDPLRLFLRAADLFLCGALTVIHSNREHYNGTHHKRDNRGEYDFEHSL